MVVVVAGECISATQGALTIAHDTGKKQSGYNNMGSAHLASPGCSAHNLRADDAAAVGGGARQRQRLIIIVVVVVVVDAAGCRRNLRCSLGRSCSLGNGKLLHKGGGDVQAASNRGARAQCCRQ